MSLVALDGTPLVPMGAWVPGTNAFPTAAAPVVQDAALEACIMFGQVFTEDGGSHTIDTTGSSSIGWRTGAVTFANAGTSFKIGLATLDAANGPPARATNVTDTITFSVSKTMTGGGGGVTANAYQTHVPDAGSLAVANGDFIAFATQMVTRGGADSVETAFGSVTTPPRPGTTAFTGGAYSNANGPPNCVITFSDGTLGFFAASFNFSTLTNLTWNSGSATKEYGNYLLAPFPMKIYGLYASCNIAGDTDFILYSDPLGTPVAEKTVSADANIIAASNSRFSYFLFAAPYSSTASQPLAAIVKPGATNVTSQYKSFNLSSHQKGEHFGTNGYAVSRASGAFAAMNSNKDRWASGLLVGAFDAGGSAATSAAPVFGGAVL